MSARQNPPWSNDILTSQWEQILAAGGPGLMPRHKKARTRITAEEFGTGHYGVVMPTMTPGIVMKLTSDADEAEFVSWVTRHSAFAKDHPGLIPYYMIRQLYGTQRLKRDVFVLWRAEAEKVGKVFSGYGYYDESYEARSADEAEKRLGRFKEYAHYARMKLKPMSAEKLREVLDMLDDVRGETDPDANPMAVLAASSYEDSRRPRKFAMAIEGARVQAEMMANEPGATEVGQVLLDLLKDHGILLADVHIGNIGEYKPDGYSGSIRVITDPGHAIFLKPESAREVGKWW